MASGTHNTLDAALHAVYTLVELGQPPNGIAPDDCGPYAETIGSLHEAYTSAFQTQQLLVEHGRSTDDPHATAIDEVRTLWASVVRLGVPGDLPLIEALRETTAPRRPHMGLMGILEALDGLPDEESRKRLALDLVGDASALQPAEMLRLKDALRSTFNIAPGWIREWVGAVKAAARARKERTQSLIPAPTPSDAPDDQKATWPYLAIDGRMLFCAQKADMFGGATVAQVPIADFTARIVEEQVGEDGRKQFQIEGSTITGRPFQMLMEAEDFADDKKLKATLTAAAGAQAPIYVGMAKHLGTAIQRLSGDIASIRRFTRTGWSDGKFLIPGREIEQATIVLGRKLPYAFSKDADLSLALQALDALFRSHGPACVGPIVSFLLTPPLALLAGWRNERYGAFLSGRTGSLKSSMAQALMCLYGPGFSRDDLLVKWGQGATNNALMAMAVAAYDLPFLIDNYKPNTGDGPKAFINLIHNIVEGGEKDRLNRSSELRDSRPVFAWPLVTGEDVPDKDPASLARVLVIPFARPADLAHLTKAQQLAPHLCAIGRAWIEWLEGDESKAIVQAAAERFNTVRQEWATALMQTKPSMVNALRVASNLATNELTWAIAEQHPALSALFQCHAEPYFAGLNLIATQMASYTAESLEAARFMSMLRDLLITGQAVLIERGARPGMDGDRMVGWKDVDGGAFLLMKIARALVERHFGKDCLNAISEKTMYSQMQELGYLIVGKDKATHVIREFDQTHRVVRMTGYAFAIEEEPH
jgi:hypothetical protein